MWDIGSPIHSSHIGTINNSNPNWKRRKIPLFAEDIVLYIENPKIPPKSN